MYKSHINVNIKQSFKYIQYSIYLIMYQSNISETIKQNSMLGFQNNGANITV